MLSFCTVSKVNWSSLVSKMTKPVYNLSYTRVLSNMEVTPRFELGNEGFADPCLTTWLCHRIRENGEVRRFLCFWSGRRGSNSLPRPWQGRALPDELRPQMTPMFQRHGASGRSRTNDTRIFSPLLYQLSYRGEKWRPGTGSNRRPLA